MPELPQYYIVGSEVGTGTVDMIDGEPIEVVGVRFVLKPMDKDDDDTLSFIGVMGREDVDVLTAKLNENAELVRYVAEQVPAENDKEGVANG